jgi:hypothetical protein
MGISWSLLQVLSCRGETMFVLGNKPGKATTDEFIRRPCCCLASHPKSLGQARDLIDPYLPDAVSGVHRFLQRKQLSQRFIPVVVPAEVPQPGP